MVLEELGNYLKSPELGIPGALDSHVAPQSADSLVVDVARSVV